MGAKTEGEKEGTKRGDSYNSLSVERRDGKLCVIHTFRKRLSVLGKE
jgi:hypothetical protein